MHHRWRSESPQDEFTTADPTWVGAPGEVRGGYRYVQPEGFVSISPPPGSTALCSWYNPTRTDKLLTATGNWAVDVGLSDYVLAKLDCRFFDPEQAQPAGSVALYNWSNGEHQQHLLSSAPEWSDTQVPAPSRSNRITLTIR